ncbi:hypothetical protein CLU79DRAFT_726516 [Phycomyces nitens]|nr:hypothetical protein CLU79DRAFT_726516 [Phycomyces nitens]
MAIRLEKSYTYICLKGLGIDAIGSKDVDRLQFNQIQNRQNRDGPEFHVTIISPPDCKELAIKRDLSMAKKAKSDTLKQLLREASAHCLNVWQDPIDLGPGRIVTKGNQTFFRVIHWPIGQVLRRKMGLKNPAFFHITTGFDPSDIYEYKGPGALDVLQGHTECTREMVYFLSKIAVYYKDDLVFMRALSYQAIRLGLFSDAFLTGWYVIRGQN